MDKESLIQEIIKTEHMERKKNNYSLHDNEPGTGKVLWLISQAEGDVHPTDLCQKMGVTTPRITIILNALEEKGLVERLIDREDRRKIVIRLTENGRKRIHERELGNRERVEKMIDSVGMDDAEAYLRVLKYMRK